VYKTFIETHFSAAHQLHGYPGHCGKLHGHTWKVRVEIETKQIDKIGISMDFKVLKQKTETILNRLDHNNINEISPFDLQNPTAENLSRYIFEELQKTLPPHIRMSQVIVWESENYAVSYLES